MARPPFGAKLATDGMRAGSLSGTTRSNLKSRLVWHDAIASWWVNFLTRALETCPDKVKRLPGPVDKASDLLIGALGCLRIARADSRLQLLLWL